jgi:hypothetical protein
MNREGIHIIDESKEDSQENRTGTVYTFIGSEDYLCDGNYPCLRLNNYEEAFSNPKAHAIRVSSESRTRYYVKTGPHGRLFNPTGSLSEGASAKELRHKGKLEWSLKEATEKVFNFYLDFLRTRNPSYINNAERELL